MKPTIPNPCAIGWDNMSPAGNGRYCSSCEKIVVDFTKMSEEEIMLYFETYAKQKTCGHFFTSQLDQESNNNFVRLILSWYKTSKEEIKYKLPRTAALFILGSTLTLMGCSSPEEVEGKTIRGDSVSVSAADTSELNALIRNDSLFDTTHSTRKN